MGNYETILVERHGAVAVVSLNRPGTLNSFNAAMRRDLLLAAREVNNDESVRVVVLTGAGRGFSAGGDLREMPLGDDTWRVDDQINLEYKPLLMEIDAAPKPWISAIKGPAAGIGSAIAMVCDLTVMSGDAYIFQAFSSIGLVPDGGATWQLVQVLGRKRAYEIIATGEQVSAQKCLEWGLCNRVVDSESLLDETLQWAVQLADSAPLSLRYAKQAVAAACEAGFAEIVSEEAQLQRICAASEDALEGVTAFLEKRKPVWKGR